MNVFNRIIMAILMLIIIVFSIIAVINIFISMFEWSTIADRIINYSKNMSPYISASILILVLVIALIIFIFEFSRRKISHANISADQSGKTMVTLKTAAIQIRESLNSVQDMINPLVKVVPGHDGIIINIFSKLVTGINVVDKTKEIRQTASNFASTNLGFKVLQTNYTATGFVTKKVKEVKPVKEEVPEKVKIKEEAPKEVKVVEEEPKEIKQEEQVENKIE